MSVTTDGIKGYEYQYKVTVLIALVTKADKINLFVEKKDSEDALLIIERSGISINIEIQVKRENNLIDIPKIVNWLTHFQERKSDKNLLQKLIDNKQSLALFVTHSRCSDSTLQLKTDFLTFDKHNSISFSDEGYKEFKIALQSLKFGDTALMKQREIFCGIQADNFKIKSDLNKVFEQCLILEEFTDEKVDNYITSLLNNDYSIAQSRTDIVYLQLLEIVKNGRDSGDEIFKNIYNHIQTNKIGTPIIDYNYKARIEESKLVGSLEKEGAILLTGLSQCGKTELAKTIATYFVKKGFDYQIHDDVAELKRFLNSNISDNKIAILEDPFGHVSLKENYIDILHKLKDLLGNKEKHHYLIVSSRVEILYEIFNSNNISDCKIKDYYWQELTIKNNEDIKAFWELLGKDKSIPHEIISIVSKGLLKTKSENLLQIGQLVYLANEEIDQLKNKDFNELEHIARMNSIEIANNLKQKNEYAANTLSIISICSSPIHHIEFQDLAYITSSSVFNLFSITEKDSFTSSFGDDRTPTFPEYPKDLMLEEDGLDAINYLEERGLITTSNKTLIITHPNYYEAGRYLFFEKGTIKQKSKLEQYKKCIGCLNPLTSFLSSRNYSFIYNRIKSIFKNEIINVAFTGLDSIFPSVEDISLIFITNFIQELEQDQYDKLLDKIQSGGTRSSNIYWYNDVPFISNEGGFSNLFVEYDELIIKRVEDLISRGIKPSIHDAWKYLEGLKNKRQISKEGIRLLLQFNEGFIRQKVVYQIFARHYIVDNEIINELFNDEHPSVIFSTIRASLINWFTLADEHKELIKKLTLLSFNKKQVAIRAFSLISTFSIDYSHESVLRRDFDETQRKELWQIWGYLYPACIKNVPLGVHINSGRFGATMDDAIKYLDVKTGLEVLESWYKRIDYQIQNNKILDEYEMAIADNLMELTSTDFNVRINLFSNLINYNDTSFLLSNLKWIVEYWNVLDKSEKEEIVAVINSERKDVRWIKAVLLNSYSPPKELLKEILGDEDFFERNIEQILVDFPENLLKDCLNVYCGFPQPLWWLAVHHKNQKFWLKLIKYILLDEKHVGFDICLQEFLNHGVNGFSNDWADWEQIWKQICKNTDNKQLLVLTLAYNTAKCTCNTYYTGKLWTTLIESYKEIKTEYEIIEFVAENIEMLQQTGHKEDLFKIFDERFFLKVIDTLQPDYSIYKILKIIEELSDVKNEMFDGLCKLVHKMNIRFFGTFNYINKLIEEDKVPEGFKSFPNLIDEIGKSELKKLGHIEEYKLDNWIGIN